MKRLSNLPSPALAGVIRESCREGAIAEIKNCRYSGAAMIDLHMSCLDTPDLPTLKAIIGSTDLPVLALNYNSRLDWSDAGLDEQLRVDSFLLAVQAGAAGVDLQGYTFHAPSRHGFHGEDRYRFTKNNPKEIVTDPAVIDQQCELIERVHGMGAEVLLSCHPGIVMSTEPVVELALFLEKRHPDIIKIVTLANTEEELAESFRTMVTLKKEVATPISYHVGGKMGRLSRIVNPLLGGQIVFCVDRYKEGSTMDQVELRAAKAALDAIRPML